MIFNHVLFNDLSESFVIDVNFKNSRKAESSYALVGLSVEKIGTRKRIVFAPAAVPLRTEVRR